MKRILIFSLTYHPFVGGAEVAIKEITDRLPEYEYHMVTLRFDRALPKHERFGNVTIHRIGFAVPNPQVSDRNMPAALRIAKLLFPLTALWKARALHRERPFDLVWAMMANQAGFAASFFKWLYPEVPYALELQDGRALSDMRERQPILRLLWGLYEGVYRSANRIKAISSFIGNEVQALRVGAPLVIIPNAVDTAKFSAPVSDGVISDLKNKYSKKMGDVFLFTASRLVLSRGVEDTIRALKSLPDNVKLLIAGQGDDRASLERIARDEGVAERVIFAGHIDHAQLPAYYRVSDIFVRPSIIEGFGNAFVEAFAAGIPVVATPVGGIPDFLYDPETNPDKHPTGVFCKVRDPESVAAAVRRLMNDPALVSEITANARVLAQEKYDWSRIAKMQNEEFFVPLLRD